MSLQGDPVSSTAAGAGVDYNTEAEPGAGDLQPPSMHRTSSTSSINSPFPVFNNTVGGSVYANQKMRPLKKDDGVPLWRADIQYDFLRAVFEDKTAAFTPLSKCDAGDGGEDGVVDEVEGLAAAEGSGGDGLRCFADIYIDAMCRSSKTSKILRQQMQNDRQSAIATAMICLLVNIGRMNTTLCFSPEMRAHLRTYHPVPCLQAHQSHPDSDNPQKQLQDAPRLKSILKRARGDRGQPSSIEDLRSIGNKPRTNPINLVFLLSQYAPKVTDIHFPPSSDFYDLVTRDSLSSASRAKAFLWLMWWYLESDFSSSAAENNPFGSGRVAAGDDANGRPLWVPELETLSQEEIEKQNVDSPEEIQYGEEMQQERRVLSETNDAAPPGKPSSKGATDDDETVPSGHPVEVNSSTETSIHANRLQLSPSPMAPGITHNNRDKNDDKNSPTPSGDSRRDTEIPRPPRSSTHRATNTAHLYPTGGRERGRNSVSPSPGPMPLPPSVVSSSLLRGNNATGAAPVPSTLAQDSKSTVASNTGGSSRRNRPVNQQQMANIEARKQRVDSLLNERRKHALREKAQKRREEEARTSVFLRAKRLLDQLPEDYDTEEEDEGSQNITTTGTGANTGTTSANNKNVATTGPRGKGGICPNPAVEDDYGEAASFYASVIRKTARRLSRCDWNAVYDRSKNPVPSDIVVSHHPAAPSADAEPSNTARTAATSSTTTKTSAPRRSTAAKRSASMAMPPSASEPSTKKASRSQASTGSNKKRSRPSASKKSGSANSPTLPVPPVKEGESRRSSSNSKKKGEDKTKPSSRLSAVPARLLQEPSDAGGDGIPSSDVDMTSNIDYENDNGDGDETQRDTQDDSHLERQQQQRQGSKSPAPDTEPKPILKSINRLKSNDASSPGNAASSSHIRSEGFDAETSSVDIHGRDYSSDVESRPAGRAPESGEEGEEEGEHHDGNVTMEAPSSLYGDG